MLITIPRSVRRISAVVLAIALAFTTLFVGGVSSAQAIPEDTTTGFSGTVIDALTSDPIQWATVIVPTAETYYASTDAAGSYDAFVAPGSYSVGFYGGASSATAPFGYDPVTRDVTVSSGAPSTGVDVALQPNGRIQGAVYRLVDGANVPVEDAGIIVTSVAEPTTIHEGSSWADGRYAVDVPAGSYTVAFTQHSSSATVAQYFDHVDAKGNATPVNVVATEIVTQIDALFPQPEGATISGSIKSEASAPIVDGVSVTAFNAVDYISYEGVIDEAGNYSITGLPAGSFKIKVDTNDDVNYVSEWYENASSSEGATAVTVAAGDTVAGIDFGLADGAIISGSITSEAGVPITSENLDIFAVDADTISPDGTSYHRGFLDGAGGYSIVGLPAGTYKVNVSTGFDLNFVGEWYENAASEDDATPVMVATGETRSGVDFPLARGATISGTVSTDSGAVINWGVEVRATRIGDDSRNYFGVLNTNGSYSIVGLPAGSYVLDTWVWPDVDYVSEWYENSASLENAKPVAVAAASEVSGINFKLATAMPPAPVTGAVVAKDSTGAGLNGVKVLLQKGYCGDDGPGVWENTTASSPWSTGGFGVSLRPSLYCVTTSKVPAGYTAPAPFTVHVTAPSPVWITVWVTGAPVAPPVQVTGAVVAKNSLGVGLAGVKVLLTTGTCGSGGAAVWENTTASDGFGIGLPAGKYCVTTSKVPAGFTAPAPFTVNVAAPSPVWITVWVEGAAVVPPVTVTGAVVAKDSLGVGLNGVKVLLTNGACGSGGGGVWENTTATSQWSSGGFGIGLTEGTYCVTTSKVPVGYVVPAPFTVTVTAPSPVWITVWVMTE